MRSEKKKERNCSFEILKNCRVKNFEYNTKSLKSLSMGGDRRRLKAFKGKVSENFPKYVENYVI